MAPIRRNELEIKKKPIRPVTSTAKTPDDEGKNSLDGTSFDIKVKSLDMTTGENTKKWGNGDLIYLWFNGNNQQTPDLTIVMRNGKWVEAVRRSGNIIDESKKNTVVAVYEGSNNIVDNYEFDSVNRSADRLSVFVREYNRGSQTCSRLPMVVYCCTTYTISSGKISVNLDSWKFLTSVQVIIKGLPKKKSDRYTLYCDHMGVTAGFSLDPYGGFDGISGKSQHVIGVETDEGVAFNFYCGSSSGTKYEFQLKRYNWELTSYKEVSAACKTVTLNLPQDFSRCQGVILHESDFSVGTSAVIGDPEGRTKCTWVQLWAGGPKFATHNVGSTVAIYDKCVRYTTPNVGGQYAWQNGTINGRAKGGKWGSDFQTGVYDVATHNWGYAWREPTEQEMDALKENCVWEEIDGKSKKYAPGCELKGVKVSGKGDYAQNSIFFPAAGYYEYKYDKCYYNGKRQYYWTSTKGTLSSTAVMGTGLNAMFSVSPQYKLMGGSVRPVIKE